MRKGKFFFKKAEKLRTFFHQSPQKSACLVFAWIEQFDMTKLRWQLFIEIYSSSIYLLTFFSEKPILFTINLYDSKIVH